MRGPMTRAAQPLIDFVLHRGAELRAGAPVFLPINPIEYHGPHLSLRNDHLVSVGLARDLHSRLATTNPPWPFLLAPELELGVDPCPGPGTISVPFAQVKRRVIDACATLADAGARRVALMTFHGSPNHALALEAGVDLLTSRGVKAISPLNLLLERLLDGALDLAPAAFAQIPDPIARERARANLVTDFHAGFFETSVALHYAPETVKPEYVSLPPCPPFGSSGALRLAERTARALGRKRFALELKLAGTAMGWYGLRPFPGYTGEPALASAAAGAAFAAAILDKYEQATRDVFFAGGRSPKLIMAWLGSLPFVPGGRNVPLDAVWRPPT